MKLGITIDTFDKEIVCKIYLGTRIMRGTIGLKWLCRFGFHKWTEWFRSWQGGRYFEVRNCTRCMQIEDRELK